MCRLAGALHPSERDSTPEIKRTHRISVHIYVCIHICCIVLNKPPQAATAGVLFTRNFASAAAVIHPSASAAGFCFFQQASSFDTPRAF